MKYLKWHIGTPPHIGWWMASVYRDPEIWRWWNGRYWSRPVRIDNTSKEAAFRAKHAANGIGVAGIEWSDYYPENARVPRVKP